MAPVLLKASVPRGGWMVVFGSAIGHRWRISHALPHDEYKSYLATACRVEGRATGPLATEVVLIMVRVSSLSVRDLA